MSISLHDLWNAFDLPKDGEIKFYCHVNHTLRKKNDPTSTFPVVIEEIYAAGKIEPFQAIQGSKILGSKYVGFFIKENANQARFIGLWEIKDQGSGNAKSHMFGNFDFHDFFNDSDTWYQLEDTKRLDAFKDRLLISWPPVRSSHLWFRAKNGSVSDFEVSQIRDIGLNKPFPGFDDLTLTYQELKTLEKNGDGGAGWISALSSVRAVYLISDSLSGDIYVGSATGENGLWGRWQEYARHGHGNNKIMIDRAKTNDGFSDNLRFSVLQTLSSLSSRKEGIAAEQRWKLKLGRRAVVLNAN